MMSKQEPNGNRYCHFFYPELENFIGEDVKNDLLIKSPNAFEKYEEKRQEGENDSLICSIIRSNSVEDFILYVNSNNYPLSSEISPSILEANSYLIDHKNTTLIEYSAFFGSIQIFQYLKMNDVELTPSMWLYGIHSKSADLILFFETNKVFLPEFDSKNEEGELNDSNNDI